MTYFRPQIFFLFLLFTIGIQGQENSLLEDIIDQFQDEVEAEIFEQSYAFLEEALSHPLSLNSISPDDLSNFFFLSDMQQNSFFIYRNNHGPFISIWELQSVPFFDKKTCQLLKPFVTLEEVENLPLSEFTAHSTTEIITRLQRDISVRRGFLKDENGDKPYIGDQNKIYSRIKNTIQGKYSMGVTLEKDAGENYWWTESNIRGPDLFSFHAEIKNINPRIEQINIGDYYLNIGQGLVTYMGYSGGKSNEIAQAVKKNNLFRYFSSRSEFNFMRGASVITNWGDHFSISPFFSYRKRDANIVTDSIDPKNINKYATSLYTSGLHRTTSEIADAKTLVNSTLGIQGSYASSHLQVNLTALENRFRPKIKPREQTYNQFYFRGEKMRHLTVDYRYLYKKAYLFGEMATTAEGALAMLQGILLTPSAKVNMSLLFRHYDRDFYSLYGSPFGESSTTRNETGLFIATEYRVNDRLEISGYIDVYEHPWYRYRVSLPTLGQDFRGKINYVAKRKYNFYISLRDKREEIVETIEPSKYSSIAPEIVQQIRFHYADLRLKNWELRCRLELKRRKFLEHESFGWLTYGEAIYQPLGSPLVISGRLSYFNTDDYDSRIYSYERNVSQVFSIPSFYNKGVRGYLNIRVKPNRKWTLEGRYEYTKLLNRETIGTGYQEIEGNQFSAFTLQFIYRT